MSNNTFNDLAQNILKAQNVLAVQNVVRDEAKDLAATDEAIKAKAFEAGVRLNNTVRKAGERTAKTMQRIERIEDSIDSHEAIRQWCELEQVRCDPALLTGGCIDEAIEGIAAAAVPVRNKRARRRIRRALQRAVENNPDCLKSREFVAALAASCLGK